MIRPACEDTFVIKNRNLKNDYHLLALGPYSRSCHCKPGHFVHIKLPTADVFFRRAFSIAHVSSHNGIEIILKVLGRGTKVMAGLRKGDPVNLLGPLGTPFKLPKKNQTALIIAGGIGFPPLLFLTCEMIRRGWDPKQIVFFYGGHSAIDILERSRIKRLGVIFQPVTEDGSLGETGLVTESVEKHILSCRSDRFRIYGCGPPGMLKATNDLGLKHGIPGQLSLEAPMPCGIGVCLGCVVELAKGGHARVCCDGPVFDIGEVML
jgi:dihydroorotate dehydrogenase electron transfer subunit